MKVSFDSVVDGINRYIDKEIYSKLNDLQEFVARLVIGRMNQNAEMIKSSFMTNGFLRTLGIVDSDGMVDVDKLLQDIRREIERKNTLKIEIPFVGTLTFCPNDVDVLHNFIVER